MVLEAQFGDAIQVEIGTAAGFRMKEGVKDRLDVAPYVVLSFPTQLGETLIEAR